MKCTTVIDKNREEEVLIFLHERREISDRIEELLSEDGRELIGYGEGCAVKLTVRDIFSVSVEDGKTYVTTERDRLQMRQRLYVLEELLGGDFVKINQSCLVRVKVIERFDASVGGSLMVTLKNGYKDYVSRRQLKTVKERIGLKL